MAAPKPELGDIAQCSLSVFGSAVNVRVVGEVEQGASINLFGARAYLVEVIRDQILDDSVALFVERGRDRLAGYLDVVRSNLVAGRIRKDTLMVYRDDLEMVDVAVLEIFCLRWRRDGRCPECGSDGDWVGLALRCEFHGVYL